MAKTTSENKLLQSRIGLITLVIAVFAAVIFIFTYWSIKKSREDSLELVRQQGAALLESLALSADNAIKANSFFDLLVQEKFADLAGFLQSRENLDYSSPELADLAQSYNVSSIVVFDREMKLIASGARGVFFDLNRIYPVIIPDIEAMLEDDDFRATYDFIMGDHPGEIAMYYLEKTQDEKYIIAILADALFYTSVKDQIGIGYLVQNIAREVGIDYILYQTPEGIIFSSKKIGPILKIEKEAFLSHALLTDSVNSRVYEFNDRNTLELVKKFSSEDYGDGLFRLGISLDKYYQIVGGYDLQMIVLSVVMFAVLVLMILYLNGKQKRIYLNHSYQRIKSLSEKVFDSITSGIIAVNTDGVIDLANRQLLDIFDIEETTIEGKRWDDYGFNSILAIGSALGNNEELGDHEATITVSSGQKNLLVNTGRLYDQKGNISGAVAVVYDYTQVKELEERARRKERLTEMGDLAAGVAHEIRNPLNAISIAAQRLLGEFTVNEEQEEFVQFAGQIRSEARRLNEIITRFLSMARDNKVKKDELDLSKVISDTVNLLKFGNQNDKVVFVDHIEKNLSAKVSEDRIKQLIINLIKNATQAVEQDGGEVRIALEKKDGQLNLTVSDTGPGISEENLKRIFSPYFTTKAEGTGLGLSIVHQIVEEIGAEIEASNNTDGGAKFRVIIQ